MEKNKRIIYLDYLRILAIVAVVMIHVSAQSFIQSDINSYEWKVSNFYDCISRWAVPIFVMISGVLFLNPNKKIDIKKVYTKNIFRIITTFIFWSAIYTIFKWLTYEDVTVKLLIRTLILGKYHLWFLYMIVGLYILIPFFRKIVESEELTKYFFMISLIFSYTIPTLLNIFKVSVFEEMYENMKINFVLGYSSYFILGYYLHSKDISKKNQKIIYILGILGFIMTIVFNLILSIVKESKSEVFLDEFTINVLLESISVFVFAKYKLSNINVTDKIKNMIYNLSKYTFGVYLVHVLVMESLDLININSSILNPIISIPIMVIIVFCISCVASAILNKIPKLNKYVV